MSAIAEGYHPTYVKAAALLGWYQLEEGEGNVLADAVSHLPDATLRGAAAWSLELPSDAGGCPSLSPGKGLHHQRSSSLCD